MQLTPKQQQAIESFVSEWIFESKFQQNRWNEELTKLSLADMPTATMRSLVRKGLIKIVSTRQQQVTKVLNGGFRRGWTTDVVLIGEAYGKPTQAALAMFGEA